VWELIRKSVEGRTAPGQDGVQDEEGLRRAVREVTGGELFWGLFAGSPLSDETQCFVRKYVCPLAAGYGLTETCAYFPRFPALCLLSFRGFVY
jgi:hypothetical protein